MASFRDQLVPIISQGLERFANSTLDRVTNNIPFSTNGIVSGRPSQKYSTENLEFPFKVQIGVLVIMVIILCFISTLKIGQN